MRFRANLATALILASVVGCSTHAMAPKVNDGSSSSIFPPISNIEFEEVVRIPQLHRESRVKIHQEWRAGESADGRAIFDVVDLDLEEIAGYPDEFVRVYVDSEGFGTLGVKISGKAYESWGPSQLVLPVEAKVGDTWSGIHSLAGESSQRVCELQQAQQCDGGVTSHCVTDLGNKVLTRDTYFCPGIGFAGYRNLVEWPTVTLYMWTENLLVDGKAVPAVPEFMPQSVASPDRADQDTAY